MSNLNIYYVYVYCNQLKSGIFTFSDFILIYEPFYIGKGHGDRYKSHLKEAKKSIKRSHKLNKIRKILKNEYEPIILFLKLNLSEQDALMFEEKYIKEIGTKYDGTGPLTNIYEKQGLTTSRAVGKRNAMFGVSRKQRMINKYGEELGETKYNEWKKKLYSNVSTSGERNGMYGKSIKQILIDTFGVDEGIKKYELIIKKSVETRKNRGYKHSNSTKENISKAKKGVKQKKIFFELNNCIFIDLLGHIIENITEVKVLYFELFYSVPMLMKKYNVSRQIIQNTFKYYNLQFRSMPEQTIITNKLKRNKPK